MVNFKWCRLRVEKIRESEEVELPEEVDGIRKTRGAGGETCGMRRRH